MTGKRILLVEDEEGIRELTALFLMNKGYDVLQAETGLAALDNIAETQPDLILLDVEMPGMNGFDTCERIRALTNAPVIFVSCRKETSDKVQGLGLGGDDYITKPFDFNELDARIQASFRRNEWAVEDKKKQSILQYDDLQIHLEPCETFVDGKKVKLLRKEFQLLKIMAQHPNKVWTAEQLYDQVWGYYAEGSTQTVKVHISNLRRKLEKDPTKPKYIQTVRGFGYKFAMS